MSRKLLAALFCAAGVVCAAADRVYISVNVRGDDAAKIEVLQKSAGVTPKAKATGLANKQPGRAQGFFIPLDADGKAAMTLKLKLTGKGVFDIAGFSFPAKGGKTMWVDCVKFVLNGETLIPAGEVKAIPFAKFRRLSGAKSLPLDGSCELAIEAEFVKCAPERAAELDAQTKKK